MIQISPFFCRSNLAKIDIVCPQFEAKAINPNYGELQTEEKKESISDGEIVAISIAVLFLLIFIACLILICYHRCPFWCCKKGWENAYLH